MLVQTHNDTNHQYISLHVFCSLSSLNSNYRAKPSRNTINYLSFLKPCRQQSGVRRNNDIIEAKYYQYDLITPWPLVLAEFVASYGSSSSAEQISAQRKEIGRNSILLIEKDGEGENIIFGNDGARQC